jgi:hypothetical protein
MRQKIFILPILIILIFTSINFSNVDAQQKMDPWTEYMTPSDMHKMLGLYEGNFNMEITMSRGEENPPLVINIPSSHQMLLGGRFLEMKQKGDMMGMAYEATMTIGYNTIDQKFAMTTITNMGTGTLSLFGDWDNVHTKATLFGSLTNPVSKQNIQVKQIIEFKDSDTVVIESYDTEGDQAEKKTVVYTLRRTK